MWLKSLRIEYISSHSQLAVELTGSLWRCLHMCCVFIIRNAISKNTRNGARTLECVFLFPRDDLMQGGKRVDLQHPCYICHCSCRRTVGGDLFWLAVRFHSSFFYSQKKVPLDCVGRGRAVVWQGDVAVLQGSLCIVCSHGYLNQLEPHCHLSWISLHSCQICPHARPSLMP